MKWFVPLVALAFVTSPALAADIEANKKAVVEFYDLAINKKDFEAAAKYFGPKYIQHNPTAPDGIEGFKASWPSCARNSPTRKARSSACSPRATS